VSAKQRENLGAALRRSAFPADSDVSEQRRLLRELTSAQRLPADVSVTEAELGGVPTQLLSAKLADAERVTA
jgi:epsilon-lactone hydrolase